ncbi:MAG TPA: MFS transporter [Dehalococcoidia bacterium]|nr:MFS transporter [Dehalococcoidia bacterium]
MHFFRPRSGTVLTGAVLGITALNFAFFTAYLCYFPTLPFFIESIGGRKSEIGLLIGISAFASLLIRPFAGYFTDTLGRKRVLLAGLVMFAINALFYNVAKSPEAIFPLRLLTGASLGTFMTAAAAYIADVAPAGRRGEVMAYYGLANSLAFAVAPALGGYLITASILEGFDGSLTDTAGWLSGAVTSEYQFTTLFLFTASVSAIAGLITFASLPDTGIRVGGRKIRPRDLFARSALFPALINLMTSFVFAAMVTFLPLFARDEGLSNPGLLFAIYAGFVILMRITLGRFMDRWSRAVFIVPGILMLTLCMFLLAAMPSIPTLFIAAALYGAGAGTFQPAMMALLVDMTPAQERGRALSTFTLGTDLGLSLGSFSLGVLIEIVGFQSTYVLAGLVAAAAAALFTLNWFRTPRIGPGHVAPPPAAGA